MALHARNTDAVAEQSTEQRVSVVVHAMQAMAKLGGRDGIE